MDKGVAMPSGGVLIDEELQAQLADDMARRTVRGMRAFLVMLAMLVLLAAWILVGPRWNAPLPERAVCAAVPLVFALMLVGMVRQGRRNSRAAARHDPRLWETQITPAPTVRIAAAMPTM